MARYVLSAAYLHLSHDCYRYGPTLQPGRDREKMACCSDVGRYMPHMPLSYALSGRPYTGLRNQQYNAITNESNWETWNHLDKLLACYATANARIDCSTSITKPFATSDQSAYSSMLPLSDTYRPSKNCINDQISYGRNRSIREEYDCTFRISLFLTLQIC